MRYYISMSKSFRDTDTELLWNTGKSRRIPASLRKVASRKLAWLDSATLFGHLHVPPANHLEALTGDRKGQFSIRINDQYHLCFRWLGNNAHDVEIVDYH
jgi:proteic killer suppression protein